jgi:tRNA U34 5-carboxymethylaminomethyl modifying GTPase MnmE/TrmE
MQCHGSKEAPTTSSEDGPIVLVGNPNVGKSVISSLLTGRYVTVSNYPGTTVEVARGVASVDGLREVICPRRSAGCASALATARRGFASKAIGIRWH